METTKGFVVFFSFLYSAGRCFKKYIYILIIKHTVFFRSDMSMLGREGTKCTFKCLICKTKKKSIHGLLYIIQRVILIGAHPEVSQCPQCRQSIINQLAKRIYANLYHKLYIHTSQSKPPISLSILL